MIKKLNFVLWAIFAMVLIASCAPKPTAPAAKPDVAAPSDTGEARIDGIDEVAEAISDSADADNNLDTAELDDVDSILADIENI